MALAENPEVPQIRLYLVMFPKISFKTVVQPMF